PLNRVRRPTLLRRRRILRTGRLRIRHGRPQRPRRRRRTGRSGAARRKCTTSTVGNLRTPGFRFRRPASFRSPTSASIRRLPRRRSRSTDTSTKGWESFPGPTGMRLRPERWAVGERGARLMRAARPIRLPPAIPSDQLEAFYLRLALDQPIASGISAGRALNYGGAAPAGWERRLQPRPFSGSSVGGPFGSSPGGKLPWSTTHMIPDLDGDDQ